MSHTQSDPTAFSLPSHPSSQEETMSLAETFVFRGEVTLLRGELDTALDYFKSALQYDATNPKLFLRQGLSLFEYGSEEGREKALLIASKKFKAAVALDPNFFDAWLVWGNTLSLLGRLYGEQHYFQEAQEKYTKALALSNGQSASVLSDLYWDLGAVWIEIALFSSEALDLQIALDSFQKAAALQQEMPAEFWIDFGKASYLLAPRINDLRLLVKAVHCFKQALSQQSALKQAWSMLAEAFQLLYSYTHDEDHFSQASECFSAATQLSPENNELWLKWSRFLCDSGRRNQDVKRLRACIEKCHRAFANDPAQKSPLAPLVIAAWAEALALLGELTNRLELIYEAENKISEAVAIGEELPDVWYSYGMCLASCAAYYNDFDYHFQAIEKFQHGLSIDRTCHRHWHAIAQSYAAVGIMENEEEELEKSIRFFSKALDLHPSSFYTFDYALALSKLGEMSEEQKWLEESLALFERALSMQKNATYLHPDWLFHYAVTLDLLGDCYEDDLYYNKAIEVLSHVLMIDPDYPEIHHRLALVYSHLGELTNENDPFFRALHHFRLALKHDEENEAIMLDWGICLLHAAELCQDSLEREGYFREAEFKMTQSAKLGNVDTYYHLATLYSLLGQHEKALHFLEKSDAYDSLPSIDEILQDDWLEGLRETSHFRAFLAQLEKRPISGK